MAKIQFPANPRTDDAFVASNGVRYTYDGQKWSASKGSISGGGSNPGITPPANPSPGTFWWDTQTGQLFTWYQDINTAQWIEASTDHGNFLE